MTDTIGILLEEAQQNQWLTGAAVAVLQPGGTLETLCLGATSDTEYGTPGPVTDETMFDLASLTKPLATVLITIQALRERMIDLKMSVRDILGKRVYASPWDAVTVEDLLRHTSGFVSWAPLYQRLPVGVDRHNWFIETLTGDTSLIAYKAGTRRAYSDLDYILLGLMLEKISETPLEVLFDEIMERAGVDLHFRPVYQSQLRDTSTYVATKALDGSCYMQGTVHDDNARALMGVAGHAGVFGSIRGVAVLLQKMMNTFSGDEFLLDRDMLRRAMAINNTKDGQQWSLGFDTPTGPETTAGEWSPPDCIGHLGFTGVSFWISPEQKTGSVFLSNRVYYNAEQRGFNRLRRAVHGALWTP